ncbi:Zn-ribbon domain-containing OB-fold protein [candidate division KSB1 bacterium]|nr:Zn-ribbon domain-containing OB-fold protein [candidate division KSB1 bacterium]
MSVPKYWRNIPQRYRLEAVKCIKCGKLFFPPRPVCNECRSQEFETVHLSDEGKIVTFTVLNSAPSKFSYQTPYPIAVIELSDSAKICAQITDCDIDKLYIGMPVKLQMRKLSTEGDAGIINYGYKAVPA